jgi:hypothetical protein
MIIIQNALDEYMKAIRLKYEGEKTGVYSSFLINPSRAKLRKLCVERMKRNINHDDLSSFNIFFGFEFDIGNLNKLKSETDKFRPIETFLKGKTELSDIEGINIAALLVDYNPRPFNRYKQNVETGEIKNRLVSVPFIEEQNVTVNDIDDIEEFNKSEVITGDNNTIKKIAAFLMLLLSLFFMGYTIKDLSFPTKECMQWEKDHYEAVDCSSEKVGIGQLDIIVPIDEKIMELKKLDSKAALVFFKNDKAIVWYSKTDGVIELFNQPGFHPETEKPLKPITDYIIHKYKLKEKQ